MAPPKSEAQRLLDLIHQERLSESNKVEPGFKDTTQWAKDWKCARSSAERYIMIALKKGLMEKKVFRVANKRRYNRVAYFRAIK